MIGDLAFFYDMNALGNRHIGNNVRILLINNGNGTEFKIPNHYATLFGEDVEAYISAAGHFGSKSTELVKHYAKDLGFMYLSAANKEEFEKQASIFVNPELADKPILFEIFTNDIDENRALYNMANLNNNFDNEKE